MTLKFSDIFGQDRAIESILSAYENDRLPHGLIFAGPSGVGKATTARALGGLFLCEKPKGTSACGKCESCRTHEAGAHPDFHVVRKELIRAYDKTGKSKGIDLSIDVIRPEVIEAASRKPNLGRGKLFVVEQADLMSVHAQGALLKTLEEPQGRALIILLTDQPDMLLPTIRSRCQIVRFAPLESKKIESELAKRGIDKTTAIDAARLSTGSLGSAIQFIDDGVIARARDLEKNLGGILRGQPWDALPEWFKSAGEGYSEKQLARDDLGSKDQANREGLNLYLRLAGEFLRARLVQIDDPEDLEWTCAAIDSLARAEMYLDSNVNVALIFQQLSISLRAATEFSGKA